MATFTSRSASSAIDFDNLDLNWYWRNKVDADLSQGVNYVYDGRTYPDVASISSRKSVETGEINIGGFDLTTNGTGLTGGTVTGLLEYNRGLLIYTIEDVEISASALQSALETQSSADERALLEAAFSGDDTIFTANGADRIYGFSGDDYIDTAGGNDTLYGGDGNDDLDGGEGADTMIGGSGSDWYYRSQTGDIVTELGGEGTDRELSMVTFTLSANVEELQLLKFAGDIDGTGNELDNLMAGNDFSNVLRGMAGNDTFYANSTGDTFFGGTGNDTFYVNFTGTTVSEALDEGIDTVKSSLTYTLTANVENLELTEKLAVNATGNDLANRITGNDAANVISGGGGADMLIGNGGDDTFRTGAGDDTVDGGAGVDTVTYAGEVTGATAYFGFAPTGADRLDNIERVIGSNGDDVFIGNDAANTIFGRAGNDRIEGRGGDDVLSGGAGNDIVLAGTGKDNVEDIGADSGGSDTIDLGDGDDTATLILKRGDQLKIIGGAGLDTIKVTGKGGAFGKVSIESDDAASNPYLNSGARITLAVDNAEVIGGASPDTVISTLVAGGVQRFTLGTGPDTIRLGGTGAGKARVTITDFDQGAAGDVFLLDDLITQMVGLVPLSNPFGDGHMRLVAEGADTLIQMDRDGFSGDSFGFETVARLEGLFPAVLTPDNFGGYAANFSWVYFGTAAGDTLAGTTNDDTISGFGGNDKISGSAGSDTIDGGGGQDTLRGEAGADTLTGGTGADMLFGDGGNDTLKGDDGNDALRGGTGLDVMTGGAGADRFVFADTETGKTRTKADRITDFSHAEQDRIDLHLIDANRDITGNQAFTLMSGAFTAAGQLRVVQSAGNTFIEMNTNADTIADLVIRLDGLKTLVAADFVL